MKLCSRLLSLILVLQFCFLITSAQVTVTANRDTVGEYDVYELTMFHPFSYSNNWEDVTITAEFEGPNRFTINGFFYDAHNWKLRFAPPKEGTYSYRLSFKTPTAEIIRSGRFICVKSTNKGFLKQHPHNPFRLVYANGSLFNGIGIGDCSIDADGNGTPHNDWGFDGDFRPPGETRPYPQYYGSVTTLDNYMRSYGSGGALFNLFRWSIDNCSFRIYENISTTGNTYYNYTAKWGDELAAAAKRHGFTLWVTFFNGPVFSYIDGSTPLEEAAIKRYINYIVARYGAYADIYELFNEAFASDYYISTITAYIRSIDPYKKLISISDPQPENRSIDINSPHWYEKESELQSDVRTWDKIHSEKRWNKPIMFGEQGNSTQNWDPLSALRMRIRSWTAFFAEGTLIFWNASWTKEYFHPVSANIYLGPEERGYIRALQQFTSSADSSMRPFVVKLHSLLDVRGYGVSSSKMVLAYFHNARTHTQSNNAVFQYRFRLPGRVEWVNPADNRVVSSLEVGRGLITLTSPRFMVDMAVKITFDSTLRVPNDQKLSAFVYPNPASDVFYIEGNFEGAAKLELYDFAGRKLFVIDGIRNNQLIKRPPVARGVYIYRLITSSASSGGKISLQ